MYINAAHELMTSPLCEIYNHKISRTLGLLEGLIDRIHFSVRFSSYLSANFVAQAAPPSRFPGICVSRRSYTAFAGIHASIFNRAERRK